jgi:16S rRNA (cytosine1402-N4)-methyltransferase
VAGADTHVPVLLKEVLEALAIREDGRYLDGTLGRGGHAAAILERLGGDGRLLMIDRDSAAVAAAQSRFTGDPRVRIEQGNFADMRAIAERAGFDREGFDGILLDLGVSSPQLDQPERGFSFHADGPLDMRMDTRTGPTAAQWLAAASEKEIAGVLWQFGEERHSRRIARAIIAARAAEPITRTGRLAEVIAAAVPGREPGKHPATRSFQAIRIFINRELDALDQGLDEALALLRGRGRLCVISFHSLEDRRVKRFIRRHSQEDEAWRGLPDMPESARPDLRPIGKAKRASAAEVAANPRARSATLRVAERLH